MNRKAEGNITPYLIGGVIAFLLLAGIIIAIINPVLLGKILPGIDSISPIFGGDKPVIENFNLFRYAITNDKVEYYDGVNWIDFSDKGKTPIEFAKTGVVYDEFYKSFQSYYYGARAEQVTAGDYKIGHFSMSSTDQEQVFQIKNVKKGDILFYVYSSNGKYITEGSLSAKGVLFLIKDNPLSEQKTTITPGQEQDIKTAVTLWKDSILAKPIHLDYYTLGENKNDKIPQSNDFCLTKRNDAVFVNLDKPYSGGSCV